MLTEIIHATVDDVRYCTRIITGYDVYNPTVLAK